MAEPMRNKAEAAWLNLIERIAQGSQAALAQFYDLTSSQVFGLVLRIVEKQSAAEEVTLEVFTSVWNTAGEYRAQDGPPAFWLLNMARRQAINRLRSGTDLDRDEKPTYPVAVFEHAVTARQDDSAAKNRHVIQESLAAIHPRHRSLALELAYFSGMTCVEIAEHTAQPTGRVRDSIRAGMTELRKALRGRQD